jgi:hypothetical protein
MEFIKGYIIGWCKFNPKSGIDSDEAAFDCEKGPDPADWLIPTTANGYWTSNKTPFPLDMKQYHIFLDGVSPSSTNRATKLVNDAFSVCVGPNLSDTSVCHPVSITLPVTNRTIDGGIS